jgi:hypothetical protein
MIDQELTRLKKAIEKETSLTARLGHGWNNLTSKPQPTSSTTSTKIPSEEDQIKNIESTMEQSIRLAKASWQKVRDNYYLRNGNTQEEKVLEKDLNEITQHETDTKNEITELLKKYKLKTISQNEMEAQVNALIKEFNNKLKRTTGLILLQQVMIYSREIGPMDQILQRKNATQWAGDEIKRWKNAPLDQLNFDTLLKDIQKRGCLPTKTVTIIRACIKPFIFIPMVKITIFFALLGM